MIRHNKTRLRRTSLALATLLAIGGGAAVSATGVSVGQGSIDVASPTAVRGGDTIMGPVAATQPVHVVVALKLRNREALDSYIASSVVTRSMTRHQLETQHLPTAEQAQAVAAFLTGAGFQNVEIAENRMIVSADATAAAAP